MVFEDGTYTNSGVVMTITGDGTPSQWVTFVSRNRWGAHMWGNDNDVAEGISSQEPTTCASRASRSRMSAT